MTSWQQAFITDPGAPPPPTPMAEVDEPQGGFFRRLRENMTKTRQALVGEIRASFGDPLEEETWERLEEALIMSDAGAGTTADIVNRLEDEALKGEIETPERLVERLREEIAAAARSEDSRIDIAHDPAVILTVGVNGTGKTTTIGKLGWHLQRELGQSVLFAGADTFRAAAQEQLERWAERAGCDLVSSNPGSDPGAVAFDALQAAKARGRNVVIVDTAGRLHTQSNLMEELTKVRRVIERQIPGAPHETLLTVDATTGQNGLRQAQLFQQAAGVTGIALTKLDGTARGGIALAIKHELEVPVKLIGIGEKLEDLRPFDPDDYARALVE